MRILLSYFFPAFIPIIIYLFSYLIASLIAKKKGKRSPKFFNSYLLKTFSLSLLIAIICFIWVFFALSDNAKTETYQPAQVIDGKLHRLKHSVLS